MPELTREQQSELACLATEWELAREAYRRDPTDARHINETNANARLWQAIKRIYESGAADFMVGNIRYSKGEMGIYLDRTNLSGRPADPSIPVFEPLIHTDVAGVSTATYSTSDFMAEIDDVA